MVLVKIKQIICLILVAILGVSNFSFSQEATPTPTPTPSNSQALADLQKKINDLQGKITDLQSQEKTLSSQIAIVDNNIKLIEYQIESIQEQITTLTLDIDTASKKIVSLQGSLENSINVLLNRIVATYEVGSIQPLEILLTSGSASDFLKRLNYLKLAQAHDKKLIYETQQAKVDYTNQKNIFEDKKQEIEVLKKQLEQKTNELGQEKDSKQRLLAETQGSEQNYQSLLANARAEYEAIQGIVSGKGTEGEIGPVNQGDAVATIIQGSSCNSTGSHVHFTVSRNGSTENPFNYLKSVDYVNQSGGDPFNPSGSWEWPISPTIQFNQGYGETWFVRNYHAYSFHNGIDINSSSSIIKAVKSGTLFQGSYSGNGGCRLRYVRVHHNDDGLDTFYLHVNFIH
jgi:peptidoglycan hydrolase CwlO-like protein